MSQWKSLESNTISPFYRQTQILCKNIHWMQFVHIERNASTENAKIVYQEQKMLAGGWVLHQKSTNIVQQVYNVWFIMFKGANNNMIGRLFKLGSQFKPMVVKSLAGILSRHTKGTFKPVRKGRLHWKVFRTLETLFCLHKGDITGLE